MPSEMKEKSKCPRREKTKEMRRPKVLKEKEDEEVLRKVLDSCRTLLSRTYENGGDIYELLDPLILDTQCHMHSVLLLIILKKCMGTEEEGSSDFSSNVANVLTEEEKEILSYGILLTLLKSSEHDEFGLLIHELAINNFNGKLMSSKHRERYCITIARKKFNSYSVSCIKKLSNERIKQIITDCEALSPNLGLKFLPCYSSIYAVIDYMEGENLPIIVSLKSIGIDENFKYSLKNDQVIYYEYDKDRKRYFYKEKLNDVEDNSPTISFGCYRLLNENNMTDFVKNCDIKNLLLISSAGHIQLPITTELPKNFKDIEQYSRELYKSDENFLIQYLKHYELAKKYNLTESRYSKTVKTERNFYERNDNDDKDNEINIYTVERVKDEVMFGMVHIYLSNYKRENNRVKITENSNSKLDYVYNLQLNVNRLSDEIAKKLTVNNIDFDQSSIDGLSLKNKTARHKNDDVH